MGGCVIKFGGPGIDSLSLLCNAIARIPIGLSRFPFLFPFNPALFLVARGNINGERETSKFMKPLGVNTRGFVLETTSYMSVTSAIWR
jgi:hypothetical protein